MLSNEYDKAGQYYAEGLARLRLKVHQSPVDVALPPTLHQLNHEETQ